MGKRRIIAFANQKGGTGKTTTVANLGACLASMKKRVLIIDMDPQGNLGQNFGLKTQELDKTIAGVLLGEKSLQEIVEEVRPNLYLAPGNIELIKADTDLNSQKAKEMRLKRALESATGFDFILIDCPPNLGNMTINSLTAADEVMVPLQPEAFSINGFQLLEETIEEVRIYTNPSLTMSGVIITMHDSRVNLHNDIAALVEERYQGLVLRPYIPRTIKLAEAQPAGKSVIDYDPKGIGSITYQELGKNIARQKKGAK